MEKENLPDLREAILFEARWEGLYRNLREKAEQRQRLFEQAREKDIHVTPEELQEEADRFRRKNNLEQADETEAWLEQNHLSLEEFEHYLESLVLIRKLGEQMLARVDRDRYPAARLASEPTRNALFHARYVDE